MDLKNRRANAPTLDNFYLIYSAYLSFVGLSLQRTTFPDPLVLKVA
jgi:hypothetical protein